MDLAKVVSQTRAYARYFNFPLSKEETCYWLISNHFVSRKSINRYLLPLTPKEITHKNALLKNTQKKEKLAKEILKIARFIPFIRLIALTGSVAANNAKESDDLDLMIVTENNALWLVRPIFLFFLSRQFPRRHPGDSVHKTPNAFCPNLWLDLSSLKIPKNRQNLYTAHEVLQIKPLFDREQTYLRFIKANGWTKRYLYNAYRLLSQEKVINKQKNLLSYLLIPLNLVSFMLQFLYMLPKITTETVSLHSAFFHKNNLSKTLSDFLKNKSL